jgi:hypothetical protein
MAVTVCRLVDMYGRLKWTFCLRQGMATSLYRVTSRSKAAVEMYARKFGCSPRTSTVCWDRLILMWTKIRGLWTVSLVACRSDSWSLRGVTTCCLNSKRSIRKFSQMLEIKWPLITTLNVPHLFHWSAVVFRQYSSTLPRLCLLSRNLK